MRNGAHWHSAAALALMLAMFLNETAAFAQPGTEPLQEKTGRISEAAAREVTRLVHQSTPTTTPGTDQRSWIVRHPVPIATLIGAAGGYAISCADSNDPCSGLHAVIGMGAGALTGVLISTYQKKRLNNVGSSQPDGAKRLVTKLGVGETVLVTTGDSPNTRGKIRSVEADHFVFIPDGQGGSRRIAYNEVVAITTPGLGRGAKIGIAAGAAVAAFALIGLARLD